MDNHTIKRLNQINFAFYRRTAGHFNRTRQSPWAGWHTLLPYLSTPLSVLDVGCGNGRFGLFLAEQLDDAIDYHGVDNSQELLAEAQTALDETRLNVKLEERDIIERPLDAGSYQLVVAFGLLHHIPGWDYRQRFVQNLAERVMRGGRLVFASWRFYEYERFRERIVPWPADFAVEKHDYLLDWRQGTQALRYCHYVDDAEQATLIQASGLEEVKTYRADGKTGNLNCYSILQHPK